MPTRIATSCTTETKKPRDANPKSLRASALECVRFSAALSDPRIVHFISPPNGIADSILTHSNNPNRAKAVLKRTHSKALRATPFLRAMCTLETKIVKKMPPVRENDPAAQRQELKSHDRKEAGQPVRARD